MAFKSNAINSQKTAVYVENANAIVTPLAVTGVTSASPGVVTITGHPLLDGDVGVFAAVGGMTQLNGTTGIVENPAANTFELHEVDTTSFTTYTTGGTFTPIDWIKFCELRTMAFTGGQSPDIDVSTVCSEAAEFLSGLQDAGEASADINFVPGDPAIQEFKEAQEDGQPRWFKVVMPKDGVAGAGGAMTFEASVRQFSFSFGVNQAYQGTVTLRLKGAIEFVGVPQIEEVA